MSSVIKRDVRYFSLILSQHFKFLLRTELSAEFGCELICYEKHVAVLHSLAIHICSIRRTYEYITGIKIVATYHGFLYCPEPEKNLQIQFVCLKSYKLITKFIHNMNKK
jgi:hypothetical protein